MTNPFEAYRNIPSPPKESREETDRRAKEKSLREQQKAIDENIKNGNDVAAKRTLEAQKRVRKCNF